MDYFCFSDHIEHIRDVAGIDYVGIGADYDGIDYAEYVFLCIRTQLFGKKQFQKKLYGFDVCKFSDALVPKKIK